MNVEEHLVESILHVAARNKVKEVNPEVFMRRLREQVATNNILPDLHITAAVSTFLHQLNISFRIIIRAI